MHGDPMKVALLDAVGIFLGQHEIEEQAFDPEIHIDAAEYGGNCDLVAAPGLSRYRWDREFKRFEPVHDWQEAFALDMQKVIRFAVRQAIVSGNEEMQAIVKKHFPAEHRVATLEAKP
jgi:hypothetical protein